MHNFVDFVPYIFGEPSYNTVLKTTAEVFVWAEQFPPETIKLNTYRTMNGELLISSIKFINDEDMLVFKLKFSCVIDVSDKWYK